MTYTRTRRDATHTALAAELRARGYGVTDLSKVGGGVGDLLVSRDRTMKAVEVKTKAGLKHSGPNSDRTRARQAEFAALHEGCVVQALTADDVDAAFAAPVTTP